MGIYYLLIRMLQLELFFLSFRSLTVRYAWAVPSLCQSEVRRLPPWAPQPTGWHQPLEHWGCQEPSRHWVLPWQASCVHLPCLKGWQQGIERSSYLGQDHPSSRKWRCSKGTVQIQPPSQSHGLHVESYAVPFPSLEVLFWTWARLLKIKFSTFLSKLS